MSTVHRSKSDEELARIRSIIERHPLPSFVIGVDIRLGEVDGDGAFWVDLNIEDEPARDSIDMNNTVAAIKQFEKTLRDDFLAEIEDRYPYFRVNVVGPIPAHH